MECSMEMKMQAIDKMIELRKQLIVMQDNINAWNGFGEDDAILIHTTSEFFNIARHTGANVESSDICEAGLRATFTYNDVIFVAYINPGDYQYYEHEIDRENGDA